MDLWRGLFGFAAFWNAAVGGAMLAAPARVAAQLNVGGDGAPYAAAMTGLLIGVFGIGYAMVAREPVRNRGIVWIGLASKVGAAVLGAMQYVSGALPASAFALGMIDLAFAAGFLAFLWLGPRSAA
jgi:hypothetical protein